MTAKPKNISVRGRRWFQRTYGNTYNSVEIFVDGERICLPRAYGYGDYYMQRAADELEQRGYLPGREHYPNGSADTLWSYCRDNGIELSYSAVDVPRQRDL